MNGRQVHIIHQGTAGISPGGTIVGTAVFVIVVDASGIDVVCDPVADELADRIAVAGTVLSMLMLRDGRLVLNVDMVGRGADSEEACECEEGAANTTTSKAVAIAADCASNNDSGCCQIERSFAVTDALCRSAESLPNRERKCGSHLPSAISYG